MITFEYGDITTCQSRAQTQCKLRLAAPDEGQTPDHLETCVGKIPQITCQQLYAGDVPPECLPPAGLRAAGAACGDDAQCQTAFCGIDADKVCGTCQAAPAAGAPCISNRCGPGLTCTSQTKCVRPGAADSACDATSPCALGLTCFRNKCVASPGEGAPCDPLGVANPTCDLTQALFCSNRACKQAPLGKAGDACGLVNGGFQACGGTAYCTAQGLGQGTCQPKAADGAACATDVTKGAPCINPAVCANGTCVLGDPSTCH